VGVAGDVGAVGRGWQDGEVAGVRGVVGGYGGGGLGGVGGAHHGVGLDRGDGLLLVPAVPVAEVGDRGADGVQHRQDLEGDEQQRPGHQAYQRHVAGGQADVVDQGGYIGDDAAPDPLCPL